MKSIFGTTAELADDDRLVVRNLPRHLRSIVHITIPADVLVETYHIDILVHIVLQTILEVGSRCNLHRHGDET